MNTKAQWVNVYIRCDDDMGGSELVRTGRYDRSKATVIDELTWYNGSNSVSVNTNDQNSGENLHRTAGGWWVLVP